MTTVLIVDDDREHSKLVEQSLRQAGLQTACAYDGQSALAMARRSVPDVAVLDWLLPDISGIDVLKHFGRDPILQRVPVIMLSAKCEEIDRVLGLELGAVDYVAKPFSIRELALRVKNAARCSLLAHGEPQAPELTAGVIRLDRGSRRCTVSGEEVHLTGLEFRLLEAFIGRRGQVLTRAQLFSEVWGSHGSGDTRTVDVHINRLRERLGPARDYIRTLRGVGYRLTLAGEADAS